MLGSVNGAADVYSNDGLWRMFVAAAASGLSRRDRRRLSSALEDAGDTWLGEGGRGRDAWKDEEEECRREEQGEEEQEGRPASAHGIVVFLSTTRPTCFEPLADKLSRPCLWRWQ